MQGMRCRQKYRIDGWIGEGDREIVHQLQLVFAAVVARAIHGGFDGGDEAQAIIIDRGVDNGASPAAEAGDGSVDQELFLSVVGPLVREPGRIRFDHSRTVAIVPPQGNCLTEQRGLRRCHRQRQVVFTRLLQDDLGVLQGLGDARLRAEIPLQHFFHPWHP